MDSDFLKALIGLAGAPLILALTQLFKPFLTDTRHYPFIAVGFGLAINLAAAWALGVPGRLDWVIAVFQGVLSGLAAAGLYSTASTLKEGDMADRRNRPTTAPPPP